MSSSNFVETVILVFNRDQDDNRIFTGRFSKGSCTGKGKTQSILSAKIPLGSVKVDDKLAGKIPGVKSRRVNVASASN